MNKKVYLVCGVSGCGKTWVCKQLVNTFNYVPHDLYYSNIYRVISNQARLSPKPILTEVPFAERVQRDTLTKMGFEVIPVFCIDDPDVIAARYLAREGKPIQKAAYTRAGTIVNRAQEWKAFHGKPHEVLAYLKGLAE